MPKPWVHNITHRLRSVGSAALIGAFTLAAAGCEKENLPTHTSGTNAAQSSTKSSVPQATPQATTAKPQSDNKRPNILWIIWDAVRADHLSLYGYKKKTSPNLDQWAQKGRIFTDCMAVATASSSAYASMLTGTMPSEHGVNYKQRFLSGDATTITELLSAAGYETMMYSGHPGVSDDQNFHQGFDVAYFPWREPFTDDAFELVVQKVPFNDWSSEISRKIHAQHVGFWAYKAAGKFAQDAMLQWLDQRDVSNPYFALMIYTEAHRPQLPSMEHRIRAMGEERAEKSKQVERIKARFWSHTFGANVYSDEELEILAGMYDATIMELDDLFGELLASLKSRGALENTFVIVTADHGELHGEYHIVGHDFSMHQLLLRVPLIISGPSPVSAGIEKRPVSQIDLPATIAQLAGIEAPPSMTRHAVSLLSPQRDRLRFAEYPEYHEKALAIMKHYAPDFDPTPWERSLRCVVDGRYKLVWGSDGRHELYDLVNDPYELKNVIDQHPDQRKRLLKELEKQFDANGNVNSSP